MAGGRRRRGPGHRYAQTILKKVLPQSNLMVLRVSKFFGRLFSETFREISKLSSVTTTCQFVCVNVLFSYLSCDV